MTPQGQVYFVDHANRRSTWHDPRVRRQPAAATQQQAQDLGPLPPNWEIRYTPQRRIYFVNHNNQTTQFADPRLQALEAVDPNIPAYKRDLKQKLYTLHRLLPRQPGQVDIPCKRNNIFETSYISIMKIPAENLKVGTVARARMVVRGSCSIARLKLTDCCCYFRCSRIARLLPALAPCLALGRNVSISSLPGKRAWTMAALRASGFTSCPMRCSTLTTVCFSTLPTTFTRCR